MFPPRHGAYTVAAWHSDVRALVRTSFLRETGSCLSVKPITQALGHSCASLSLCWADSPPQPPLLTLVQAVIFLPPENQGNTDSLRSRRGSLTMLYPEATALGICKQGTVCTCTSSCSMPTVHVQCRVHNFLSAYFILGNVLIILL